jgi:hypothetical protein
MSSGDTPRARTKPSRETNVPVKKSMILTLGDRRTGQVGVRIETSTSIDLLEGSLVFHASKITLFRKMPDHEA